MARGSVFRRRHRLHGPIALYGGRIDPGKGCEELIEYFSSYVKEGGEATLALMGAKLMSLPEEPFIRFAGLLSRQRTRCRRSKPPRWSSARRRTRACRCSRSRRCRSARRCWSTRRSAVLVEHCVRSNAGLWYADRRRVRRVPEPADRATPSCATALGRNGRDYVRRNYRWDVVLGKYERIFAKVRNAR